MDVEVEVGVVERFIAVVDGEKDPRNLVVVFGLTAFLVSVTSSDAMQRVSDALFDVVGCYFPITFHPPVHDPHHISTAELQVALRTALTSHPSLAPHLLPLVLEKLDDSGGANKEGDGGEAVPVEVQLDCLLTLSAVLQPHSRLQSLWMRSVLPFCGEVQAVLKRLWIQHRDTPSQAAQGRTGHCSHGLHSNAVP